ASVDVDTSGEVAVDVTQAHIVEHALLDKPIQGSATYNMRFDLRRDEARVAALGPQPPDRLSMLGELNGTLGSIPASAKATMVGVELDGHVVLPEVTPDTLKTVLPQVPLTHSVSAAGRARGRLPTLRFSGYVDVPQGAGMGTISGNGSLAFDGGLRLTAEARVDEVDPRIISEAIPESRVNGRARITLALPEGSSEPLLEIEASTHAAEIAKHVVPAIDAVVVLHQGILLGSATVWEAGIPLDVRVSQNGPVISYSVMGESTNVAESPRIAPYLGGAGKLRVDGTYSEGRIDASAHAALQSVATRSGPDLRAAQATVDAKISGPLDALQLDATASSNGLELADEQLDRVTMSAKGPVLAPHVTLSVNDDMRGKIDASAKISIKDREATDLSFEVKRSGVEAKGSAKRLGLGPAGPVISGATISGGGLGKVEGNLAFDRGELVGKLVGRDVDLERAATLIGLPVTVAGLANIDVELRPGGGGRNGHVEIEVEGGKLAGLDGVSTRISAELSGKNVKTSGFVRLVDVASDEARGDASKLGLVGTAQLCDGVVAELRFAGVEAALAGPLLDPRSWTHAIGSADIVAENWNLACLSERLPARSNPFDEVAGVATLRARLLRREGDAQPSVEDLDFRTRGLVLVGKDDSFESRRLDVTAEGGFDGKTGTAKLETVLRGSAFRAEAAAAAILDLDALMDPARRQKTIENTSFEVDVTLPRRPIADLASLPEPLAEMVPDVDGEMRLELELWGTITRPELHVLAKGFGVAMTPSSAFVAPLLPPLNLSLDATFDPDENSTALELDVIYDKRSVAGASATLLADPRPLLSGTATEVPWKADLFAQLFDFPLGSLPVLADRSVSGGVSGRLSVKGIHDEPSVEGALTLREVKIGDVALNGRVEGKITPREKDEVADVDAGAIDAVAAAQGLGDATLRVDIEQTDGGKLQVLGYAGARWQDLVVPTIDSGSAGGFALSAQAFRLTTLHPFVADLMSRLDGRLDGNVAVEWGRLGEAMQGRFSDAKLDVSDVTVFIPQIGQELSGGRGAIRLGPAGKERGGQELLLERFEAKGISGRVKGEASALFRGLKFVEAEGKLTVAPGEELPITVEGVPIGKARGETTVKLTPREVPGGALDVGTHTEMLLEVSLSKASIELPASSSRNVQSLDPAAGVTVLQPIEAPREKRSSDAIRWIVMVDVNDAEVRSAMLDARLSTVDGRPLQLILSDRLHASGDILLGRGTIQLQNRRFVVDQALVRLRDEDASNPYVNLTAHWDAQDGTRVFVDYVGILQPITDSKIRFRSDPPKPQSEVLALLLFGESGQGGATATGLVGTVGSSVATSIAGDLVSAVFGGVLQDVAVNVGSTEEGNFYGAQISVTEDWRIGGQYEQFGQGTNNATTTQRRGGCADLFADWSFARNWSLRGSTGYCSYDDDGSAGGGSQDFNLGIDVLWQYRY
ncbi:MAG: hypothetical protein HOV80_30535, partial [Polyangiaceae bacterium]|nr:hypothetical protein [Polyangiaceae bacterium]